MIGFEKEMVVIAVRSGPDKQLTSGLLFWMGEFSGTSEKNLPFMLLSCISKKSWHTYSKLPREVTWKDILVHGCGPGVVRSEPYYWICRTLYRLRYLRKAGEGTSLSRTLEKRDRWEIIRGWRSEVERPHPAFPEIAGFWPRKADVNMDHTSYVLSLVGCTLWTLLTSFIPMMLQNKCHWVLHKQLTQNPGMSAEERSVAGLDSSNISTLKG